MLNEFSHTDGSAAVAILWLKLYIEREEGRALQIVVEIKKGKGENGSLLEDTRDDCREVFKQQSDLEWY